MSEIRPATLVDGEVVIFQGGLSRKLTKKEKRLLKEAKLGTIKVYGRHEVAREWESAA
jgi:hypothetical protein